MTAVAESIRSVEVRGRRARYRETGTGMPVLLLHGIARSLEDWDEQHRLLADGHRLISLDLAGYGESEPLREPILLAAPGPPATMLRREQTNLILVDAEGEGPDPCRTSWRRFCSRVDGGDENRVGSAASSHGLPLTCSRLQYLAGSDPLVPAKK
jgi:pimeloyl-ACP methyl ester carboxylesterase